MNILIAPDSFKGSLEAAQLSNIIEKACYEIFPKANLSKLAMADGGEGTVLAVLPSLEGEIIKVNVQSPDFRPIEASYGIFDSNKAIMEMAEASGITKVSNRDIFKMNTFGTGEMVLDGIKRGVRTFYIGIGGSATNDCGIGFAAALGVKFLDENNNAVFPIPENFLKIRSIDDSEISPEIVNTKFVVMCDVESTLLGKKGATYVFAKQKGASTEALPLLEKGMAHIAQLFEEKYGNQKENSITNKKGSGAAGGLGACMFAILNAKMQSGISTILDILDFDTKLKNIDLVISGEGRMDYQSAFGKVLYGIGLKCKEKDIPCIAIVGSLGEGYEDMYKHGITSVVTTVDSIMPLEEAVKNAESLSYKATVRALRLFKAGMNK